MARIHRRKLLKLSGAGALAAKTGGIAAILAGGRAPAYAQGTTVHWLRWNDFVPNSDKVLREQLLPACAKDLGIALNIEMINGNDLQARTTAATLFQRCRRRQPGCRETRQGPRRLVQGVDRRRQRRQEMARRALVHRWP